MKNKVKYVIILLIIITIINILFSNVYGFSVKDLNGTISNKEASRQFNNVGQNLVSIISTIASIISVIVLIVLGIKYMMGSVEERANYKKSMMPYVIGAVIVFGASQLASIVYKIAIKL